MKLRTSDQQNPKPNQTKMKLTVTEKFKSMHTIKVCGFAILLKRNK